MDELFYQIYGSVPRQGPGSRFSTEKAIRAIPDLPADPMILDVGCGAGAQTLVLAGQLGGTIIAVDNHKPYLRVLERNAEIQGFEEVIVPTYADMFDLDFPDKHFDLVWAEGSIYIMGFGEGLKTLKKFLKNDGYLAVSEVAWLKDSVPAELREFWEREYPEMTDVEANLVYAERAGFDLVDYFVLPPTTWWDDFYTPLEKQLKKFRKQYSEDEDALELIELSQFEIDLYRKYPDYYSYVFYILKKRS